MLRGLISKAFDHVMLLIAKMKTSLNIIPYYIKGMLHRHYNLNLKLSLTVISSIDPINCVTYSVIIYFEWVLSLVQGEQHSKKTAKRSQYQLVLNNNSNSVHQSIVLRLSCICSNDQLRSLGALVSCVLIKFHRCINAMQFC